MIDETKIMQYADGTLPIEEREEVQKAIEADPKLKELYNTFKETGDLLFKLSNEVKSKPLPQNLQEKAEILKSWNRPVIKDKDKSFNGFTIDSDLVKQACKDAIVLHCLPAYRNKEITDEVIESKNSRIFDQAENRMHVQQALLAALFS